MPYRRSARPPAGIAADGVAESRPIHALDSLGVREHVRRSVEIAMQSFGIAPAGAPAHVPGHPTSSAVCGRRRSPPAAYVAHLTQRCTRRASYGLRMLRMRFYLNRPQVSYALCGRDQATDWWMPYRRSARPPAGIAADGFAESRPIHALDSLGVREHVRRSVEIAMQSLGIAPAGAPAHARGHPTSRAVPSPTPVSAGGVNRPPNPTLHPTGELWIAHAPHAFLFESPAGELRVSETIHFPVHHMAKHDVSFSIPQRALGKADVKFQVKSDGAVHGTLEVSNGSVVVPERDKLWFQGRLEEIQRGHDHECHSL
jgi:hypothetical protein